MRNKKTIIVKITGDDEEKVLRLKKQTVTNLKHEYLIIFVDEGTDYEFDIVQCDDDNEIEKLELNADECSCGEREICNCN